MPVQTPHFPDQLFESAARLRRWEAAMMGHLSARGFRELHPSLVLREPLGADTVRFFDGDDLVALRWDFTLALARLLVRRFADPPQRVSYAGAVFRRSRQPWEPVERFEVGCELIQADVAADSLAADLEIAELLASTPRLFGLQGGILQLGSAALLAVPMSIERLPGALSQAIVAAMSSRAAHRVREALGDHPARARLMSHVEALLVDPDLVDPPRALAGSPYAGALAEEATKLAETRARIHPLLPPGLGLRVDLADMKGFDFYTGPTLRLWSPGAQQELASGGRYDGLFPELGRPWRAAGFCVRLTPLLDLADTHPELFAEAHE